MLLHLSPLEGGCSTIYISRYVLYVLYVFAYLFYSITFGYALLIAYFFKAS